MDASGSRWPAVAGSMIAVPVFILVFFAAGMLTNAAMIFFGGIAGEPPTRWLEFVSTIMSGSAGVIAGRYVCEHALRAWNGWPAYVLLGVIVIWGAIKSAADTPHDWWATFLAVVLAVAALIAGWIQLIARD